METPWAGCWDSRTASHSDSCWHIPVLSSMVSEPHSRPPLRAGDALMNSHWKMNRSSHAIAGTLKNCPAGAASSKFAALGRIRVLSFSCETAGQDDR